MTDPVLAYADQVLGPNWRLKAAIRATMFDKQLRLHDDPALFKEAHAGRRGGKSDGIPKSSCMDALDAGHNEVVLLISETLKKCKALHWANLHAVVLKHKLPFEPNGQEACWITPRGGRIQFWGLADQSAVELLRGFKPISAKVDECATVAPLLPRLVTDVLEPALGDTGGSLTLYGSPSVTRAGPWFNICEGTEASRWSHHHWDVRSNPHFRPTKGGGAQWLEEVLKRNEWTWDHPTFRREYLGLFVDDTNRMVVEFDRLQHVVPVLPPEAFGPSGGCVWRTVCGVDYGYNDAFAVVVLAADPYTNVKYVVHAEKASRLTYDDAAEMLRRILTQWGCTQVVCDPAGGGKPFYETFNRKYGGDLGVNVTAAHKIAGSIVESIRFQGTELRIGRLKLVDRWASPLADEWQVLPWKDDWRDEVDEVFPQDLFDACRYALMETMAWTARPKPTEESEADRLERVLREQTESHFRRESDDFSRLQERY